MKVFLSWSGNLSHKVALALRDWLPSVLQYVDPYVSSEDIDKGARWSTDIAKELEASAYGIVIVTKANMNAPWIAFESGALSKALDKSRVSPLLFGVKRSEVQGPLLQFQSTIVNKNDIRKLLISINKAVGDDERLEPGRLNRVLEVWWPELKEAFEELESDLSEESEQPEKPSGATDSSDILEEVLELVRSQQKILTSPDQLLPPEYLEYVLARTPEISAARGSVSRVSIPRDAIDYIEARVLELQALYDSLKSKKQPCLSNAEYEDSLEALERLANVTDFLARRARPIPHHQQSLFVK